MAISTALLARSSISRARAVWAERIAETIESQVALLIFGKGSANKSRSEMAG